MQRRQAYNPFLPLNEYIPDGEPHVFGNRVYLYGSHDREGGYTFCMEDYVVYSAPVDDLTDWRREGVTYRASQDPAYPRLKYMYAPDVVRGNDGKYYLYYCMGGDYGEGGYTGPISVARCDTPAGKYEYLGCVCNPDGTPMMKYVCFDPAVLNDNGTIRIYYGTRYGYEEEDDLLTDGKRLQEEISMYGRTKEEILSYQDSINGPSMAVLEDDMLTVKEEPCHIIPYRVKGTDFEEHPFFEGSSMRKIGNKYYFIYSSWLNHELCYAVSDYPDRNFSFGGTIVSNGDIGFNGRKPEDRLNMTGTTHGSIVEINGQWYVFYHRLTHKSDYSRQACAEKIHIDKEGHISQVEVTSCGLNAGPLEGRGVYPAVIACNITNGHMPHGSNSVYTSSFPNVTNLNEDRFIGEIGDKTMLGYKYFDFREISRVGVVTRREQTENMPVFSGPVRIDERCLNEEKNCNCDNDKDKRVSETKPGHQDFFAIKTDLSGRELGRIVICDDGSEPMKWKRYSANIHIPNGVQPLYLIYHGENRLQLLDIFFE